MNQIKPWSAFVLIVSAVSVPLVAVTIMLDGDPRLGWLSKTAFILLILMGTAGAIRGLVRRAQSSTSVISVDLSVKSTGSNYRAPQILIGLICFSGLLCAAGGGILMFDRHKIEIYPGKPFYIQNSGSYVLWVNSDRKEIDNRAISIISDTGRQIVGVEGKPPSEFRRGGKKLSAVAEFHFDAPGHYAVTNAESATTMIVESKGSLALLIFTIVALGICVSLAVALWVSILKGQIAAGGYSLPSP
jgi:hypothetical protein